MRLQLTLTLELAPRSAWNEQTLLLEGVELTDPAWSGWHLEVYSTIYEEIIASFVPPEGTARCPHHPEIARRICARCADARDSPS